MWLVVLLCCVLDASVARPPANASLLAPDGTVRAVDRIYHGGGKAGYLLYLDEQRFQLDMERDETIPDHQFSADAPPRRECVYRGTVNSNAQSLAVFNLCGGGLEGFFALDHSRYTITPVIRAKGHENDVHIVEDADATRALHLYTRERFSFEAMPERHSCGTRDRKTRKHKKEMHGRRWWTKFIRPDASPTRRKRSVSRARHVELLLVADASMTKKYGKDLQHYLLTLASIASKLYGHASIENPIRLSVVKVALLSEHEKGIEISKNAAATLKSFCKWQNQQNPLDDDHQHHHDAAILFTRQDLCGHHSCDTLGMADVGTVCSPERSCAIIEDDGLHAAFTVAHEIGHLLGLSHDDSKFCEERFGSSEDKRLMSSILTSIDASKPWSRCTSNTITDFFDDGNAECLLDAPRVPLLGPEELPGQSYDAVQQCRLAFGSEYSVCPGMDICARLWCSVIRKGQMVCLTKKLPAVEGTPCGKGRICLQGKCVDKTKKRHYSTSKDGSWSSWGAWGSCSRSCGGGVQFAQRLCNNPAPRNNGRYCTGKRAVYRSCSVTPCPTTGKSFRQEQCEVRNGPQTDPKGVKTLVEWVPKFAGVLPKDVCKLTCRAKGTGYYVVFSQRVVDGTECRPYSSSVCVKGKCVRTGCDGIIGSKLQYDKCGICGGDGNSCIKVAGNFTKKSKGYTDVVKIPEGSTHLKVRQYKAKGQSRYTAYLALRRPGGDYLLNGKLMISTSETIIPLNGSVLNYTGWSQRDEAFHSMGPAALQESLLVQILSTDAKKPLDIRYSFFMPRKTPLPARTSPEAPPRMSLEAPPRMSLEAPPRMSLEAPPRMAPEALPRTSPEAPPRIPPEAPPRTPPEAPPTVASLSSAELVTFTSDVPPTTESPKFPRWLTGPWMSCSRTCDTGWQSRTVQCKDANGKLSKNCPLSARPSAFKHCLIKKC
ncbi:A disintegrin and metalloproteinase with thrombospondin motifs 5 precursor [Danio rerio]|uniref:A disintegrin and metalloproteinase with thrombospondin motifs 5 precursor n=1 Tax=Danio rerio TaxID=7955 RepID=G3G3J8_DANRE|nr:A disintegrin and metalloproteinase with thrombospondin motifs 5 precursor [Danio rerio]AEO79845.1 ADAMTS5 [Danio rerio]|eukprot:NP_001289160.1 A disintegrin and metalloproteinase with thrombospondin motifs 5 precursor [Danio rerio]